jgi:hypothetical protein
MDQQFKQGYRVHCVLSNRYRGDGHLSGQFAAINDVVGTNRPWENDVT